MQDILRTRRRWFADLWHRYRHGIVAIATAFILLVSSAGIAQTQAPNLYPPFLDPYVNDHGQVLNANDKASIRGTLAHFTKETQVQVVVLTIHSIEHYRTGDSFIEDFANNLFNTWKLGDPILNDGILILVAAGDRQVRIQLGAGYDAEDSQVAKSIIREHMLPYFREGQISQGTVSGVNAVVKQFNPYPASPSTGGAGLHELWRQIIQSEVPYWWNQLPSFIQVVTGGLLTFLIGLPILKLRKRYGKQRCSKCRGTMTRLNEQADDRFLTAGQKKEEELKSVNYDVWLCKSCGHSVAKPYANPESSFEKCNMCYHKTLDIHHQTLRSPTYDAEGEEKVTETCEHCGYTRTYQRTLSQRTQEDDQGSTYGKGGRSSGGGATGNW